MSVTESIFEGHDVAQKTGLGVDQLQQFIDAVFSSPDTAYSNRMRSGDSLGREREEPVFLRKAGTEVCRARNGSYRKG